MVTRRRMLVMIGAGAIAFAACGSDDEIPVDSTGRCPPTPEQEEGPFYQEGQILRSDIADGQSGVVLELWIKVLKARTCEPVARAAVEVWSANAAGRYSGQKKEQTEGERFLRGIQVTDAAGFVNFRTIYPGWYAGRACHIHFKVFTGGEELRERYSGGRTAHTGQLFFPPEANASLQEIYPENRHRFINNDADPIYQKQGGDRCVIKLEGSLAAGFAGTAIVDIQV